MSELNPIPFIVALGVLVTIHELGHFVAAKLCGVRVLKFSIGFGPPIGFGRFRLRFARGGTEYVIAWIPLGGFVKMLGENPGEERSPAALADRAHSLPAQPLWKKLAIVLAGPFVNLALPVAYFLVLLWIGIAQPLPRIGGVEPGSPAERAGLQPGDEVVAVDGEPVELWGDVNVAVLARPGERITLTVERGGARRDVPVAVESKPSLDASLPHPVGWIGAEHRPREARVVILDSESLAARAGLRSGDRVTRVGGQPVGSWFELEAALAAAAGEVRIGVERDERSLELTLPGGKSLAQLGATPLAFSIESVSAGEPAARAGLAPGDLIVSLDGRPIPSFRAFVEAVRGSEGRPLEIGFARDGELRTVRVAPIPAKGETTARGEPIYRLGVGSREADVDGATADRQVRNPIESVPMAIGMTYRVTKLILGSLSNLFASVDTIGGPIAIASQSKQAWERGIDAFVSMVVFLSINLGVLNLLPIPVLDGGQAVMFTAEAALRGRFTLRAREIAQTVGVALLLMLMGVAFYNDVTNYVIGFVKSLLRT
jgi:regulator of sigma E protease